MRKFMKHFDSCGHQSSSNYCLKECSRCHQYCGRWGIFMCTYVFVCVCCVSNYGMTDTIWAEFKFNVNLFVIKFCWIFIVNIRYIYCYDLKRWAMLNFMIITIEIYRCKITYTNFCIQLLFNHSTLHKSLDELDFHSVENSVYNCNVASMIKLFENLNRLKIKHLTFHFLSVKFDTFFFAQDEEIER